MPFAQTNNSWRSVALPAAAVAAVLVVGVVYMRSGSAPDERAEPGPAPAAESGRRSDRVERRLQALRDAHDRAAHGNEETSAPADKVQVRSGKGGGAATAPDLRPKMRQAVPAQPAAPADGAVADDSDQDPDDIPGLRKMALEDTDPERRLAAVTLLGASDDPEAIPILAQSLQDQDEEVRLAAIQSLADVTGEVPVDVIGSAALNDPSADNRYEALEVLSDVGNAAARTYIEKALNDPDEDVKSLAEGILDLEDTYEDDQETQPAAMNPTPHK